MRVNSNSKDAAKSFLVVILMLFAAPLFAAAAQDGPYRVLVLESFRNTLAVNTDWHDGILRGFKTSPDPHVEIDVESPDLSHFGEEEYIQGLIELYRFKYRDQKPHLIIPTYTPALQFLLDYGEELFPGVPIVFCGASSRFLETVQLRPNITGVSSFWDIAGTVKLALQLQPDTRRVMVIVGAGAMDQKFERVARAALLEFENKLEFSWIRGAPLAELSIMASELPEQSVILYLVQMRDRDGQNHIPISMVAAVSSVTKAPIYGLWDTLIGHGIIGGRLVSLEEEGYQAAQMSLRILRGESPAAIPIIDKKQNRVILDGRELARWNISANRVPEGSLILNRQLSFWDEHRTKILLALLIILIQGLFIAALMLSRLRLQRSQLAIQSEIFRRRQSDSVASELRATLTKFSKERSLGIMATGIAHEINQPLIAIQNYAQAARRRIQNEEDQKAKLTELVEKIERQAGRAGGIIQHLRTLVNTDDADLQAAPLHTIVEQVIQLMEPGLKDQGFSLEYTQASKCPKVLADPLEIQLVLVNLVQNAVESMDSKDDVTDKKIRIQGQQLNEEEVQVTVADRGPGIPPEKIAAIFEPFYSSTKEGMGMGLAICRAIMDAHGGRIWCDPEPGEGAKFHFTLRIAAG